MVAGQNLFPKSMQKSQIAGGLLHDFSFVPCLAMFSKLRKVTKNQRGENHSCISLRRSLAPSAWHFHSLPDEEDDVLQSDSCANSCNDRLW